MRSEYYVCPLVPGAPHIPGRRLPLLAWEFLPCPRGGDTRVLLVPCPPGSGLCLFLNIEHNCRNSVSLTDLEM